MASHLLLISDRSEDLRFAEVMAFANDCELHHTEDPAVMHQRMAQYPEMTILWGADNPEFVARVSKTLKFEKFPLHRVFALTDGSLHENPHLFENPFFGHHLHRQYHDPATLLYAKLVGATMVPKLTPFPFGIQRYFPEGSLHQRIKITQSKHKRAAVEAIQKVFTKLKLNSRLAALAAKATDELIMNALFQAPVLPNGLPYRKTVNRMVDFELLENETVELEIMSSPEYMGISVADQFGSLNRDVVLDFLRKDYQAMDFPSEGKGKNVGLGLHKTLSAGLSLLFLCKPKVRTEVMLFVPNVRDYKVFRKGFRFVSLITPET